MVIFPLRWPAKIVLMLIAVVLGLIWSMLSFPKIWRKMLGKSDKNEKNKTDEGQIRKN
jgi:hypothetical protein